MNIEKAAATAVKLGKVLNALRKIALVCMIVIAALMTVLTVVNFVKPDAVIGEGFNIIDIGPLTFELIPELAPSNGAVLGYAWVYAVLGIAAGTVIWLGLGYVGKILECISAGKPFRSETARCFKKLSWLCLAMGLIDNIAAAAESAALLKFFPLEKLTESGAITHITANIGFDLTFVIVFFLFMLMSYVFSYGEELQQLSDETV